MVRETPALAMGTSCRLLVVPTVKLLGPCVVLVLLLNYSKLIVLPVGVLFGQNPSEKIPTTYLLLPQSKTASANHRHKRHLSQGHHHIESISGVAKVLGQR